MPVSSEPTKRGRPRKNPAPDASLAVAEGDEAELSDKEVEQMLERLDREAAGLPEPPAIPEPAVIDTSAPHALDDAPVNSKIVVTDEGAVLATPASVSMLPKTDPASRLPRGARIVKAEPTRFIASQLSATTFVEPKHYASAAAAIADFVNHFHARGSGA